MKIVILAGGTGTRLWPISREKSPKQIKPLIGSKTLLQQTYQRIRNGFKPEDIFLSINQNQFAEIKRQLPSVRKDHFIVEPVKRNTAAAIGLASVILEKRYPNEVIATANADHYIKNEKEFIRILKLAERVVKDNPKNILLIGVNPNFPDTGSGYIKLNKQIKIYNKDKVFSVECFVEKPDLKTAESYLKNWAYLWNPAYFVFRPQTMLANLKDCLPHHYKILMAIKNQPDKLNSLFPKIKSKSVDYGIMEKAKNLLCLPASFDWVDIGHWQTLQEVLAGDKSKNVVKGKYLHIDGTGNLIYSYTNKLIATIGIKNTIIVETENAILVCPKNRAQEVRKIVEMLEKRKMREYL